MAMKEKKERLEEKSDSTKRLKRRYAKWKEKRRLQEILEIDDYAMYEPEDLDLERRRW
jgi:hypothetical protein